MSVKWGREKFDNIELNSDESPELFKAQLFALSGVAPERQKVMFKGSVVKVHWSLDSLTEQLQCILFELQNYLGIWQFLSMSRLITTWLNYLMTHWRRVLHLNLLFFHSIIMMIIDFEFTILPFVLYLPVELVKMEKCNIL